MTVVTVLAGPGYAVPDPTWSPGPPNPHSAGLQQTAAALGMSTPEQNRCARCMGAIYMSKALETWHHAVSRKRECSTGANKILFMVGSSW